MFAFFRKKEIVTGHLSFMEVDPVSKGLLWGLNLPCGTFKPLHDGDVIELSQGQKLNFKTNFTVGKLGCDQLINGEKVLGVFGDNLFQAQGNFKLFKENTKASVHIYPDLMDY